MADSATREVLRVAELNDLLQLDHDAVGAYGIAIEALKNPSYKERLRAFRGDHERHIKELTGLIRERGGVPLELPHLPTGAFKLAVQKAGALAGGDRAVLLAFKANERQVRDKYRRCAERADDLVVADVLARAAEDEQKHYTWVLETLEDLGAGADSTIGKVEQAVEIGHARMADVMEGAGKGVMAAAEGVRRAARRKPLQTALVGVGILAVAAALTRRR
jgi:hypothetical protein